MRLSRIGSCFVIGWAAGGILTQPSSAALRPMVELMEVIMDAQGNDGTFIARAFGSDSASPINYMITTAPDAKSFEYSVAPGSRYMDDWLSISTQGVFNPLSGGWDITTSGQLGNETWSGSGTTIFGSAFNPADDPEPQRSDFRIVLGPVVLDYHSVVQIIQTPNNSHSSGTFTFTVNDAPVASVHGIDYVNDIAGDWHWYINSVTIGGRTFQVAANGTVVSPTYMTSIQRVPGPGGIAALLLGAAMVVSRKRPPRA
ncbi:MAG: hypothetical protein JSR77_06795 [Planctomycetes bacterium]|nr:hypothetical protein [Planctomycetota bacterium]